MLLDTGPLVAFLNRRDAYHAWACAELARVRPPLRTCEPVLAEACHLVGVTAGGPGAVLELVARGLVTAPFRVQDEAAALGALVAKWADVPMSLADACLVRMAEQAPDETVMTLDSDFRIYRTRGRHVLRVVMPPDR